jgi:transcriptional regulator with XRE-family HTH domain
MSIVDCSISTLGIGREPAPGMPPHSEAHPPLHRLGAVRRQQGVSRRTMARRLNVDLPTIKQQEDETSDLNLSTLLAWQRVLEVPLVELLVDSDDPLSGPILKRAKMVRLMKTATAIIERARQPGIRRMAQMLAEQLIDLMPELAGVSPWHAVGKRRTRDEVGQAAHRSFSTDAFRFASE